MKKNAERDSWPVIRRKLEYRYPDLTNKNLNYEEGKEEELLEGIQETTGKSWEQLLLELNTLLLEK